MTDKWERHSERFARASVFMQQMKAGEEIQSVMRRKLLEAGFTQMQDEFTAPEGWTPEQTKALYADAAKEPAERKDETHEVYFVSSPEYETVAALALWIAQGRVPDLYKTPDSAISAWEGHPAPCRARYRPWAVQVHVSRSTGLPVVFGRRDLSAGEDTCSV